MNLESNTLLKVSFIFSETSGTLLFIFGALSLLGHFSIAKIPVCPASFIPKFKFDHHFKALCGFTLLTQYNNDEVITFALNAWLR